MRVGIAGLGKMGSVFADRIKAAGHELAVWNRTPGKARAVAGATAGALAWTVSSGPGLRVLRLDALAKPASRWRRTAALRSAAVLPPK